MSIKKRLATSWMREMIKLLEPHFLELTANLACGSGIQIPMGVLLSKDIVFD